MAKGKTAKVGVSKRVHVPAEVFVKAVLEAVANGTGYAGISAATGIKATSVATRISTLRKKGVNLPKMPRHGGGGAKKLDVSALNSLIAQA